MNYLVVLFDWGDTVMRDDPDSSIPMVEWPHVETIDGVVDLLAHLNSASRRCILATSASISDERQIRAALDRVGAGRCIERIYCFKNTGLPKGQAFYRFILEDLGIDASQAVMVGDSFQYDVLIPNSLGIHAVWFNPRSDETRTAELHSTAHSMPALLAFFRSLD